MKRLAATLLTILVYIVLVSCGQPEETTQAATEQQPPEETTAEPIPSPSEEATTENTNSGTTSGAVREEVLEAEEGSSFTAAPEAGGGETGAAESISEVRFGVHEGYERAVMDFGSGGSAASGVPRWSLVSPTGEGYVRIYLPGLTSTAVSGGDFGAGILADFYVVRAPEGGFFVDIFATGAFQYRVLELENPGRLAIDLRPASVDLAIPLPTKGGSNVVMAPRPGQTIASPLSVSGYSRNFEASTTIRLLGPGGEPLAEQVVLANDWTETWGYFEGTLEFPAFTGEATLQVGAPSARDGTFEGVEVPVVSGS
ncbi:MAG: Gmad2 immunoglobulin-like domain-containing protein [Rubrobacteraceae bacterium]